MSDPSDEQAAMQHHLVCGQKFQAICQMCVQKFSHLKMGQSFENTTFRFLNISAVSFLRPCPFYTSDAADDMQCVDLGCRRTIKKFGQNCKISALEVSTSKTENGTEYGTV